MKSSSSIFSLATCATGVVSKKTWLTLRWWKMITIFFSKHSFYFIWYKVQAKSFIFFIVLAITITSILISYCVWEEKGFQLHSFVCSYPVIPATSVILFLYNYLGTLIKNQWSVFFWSLSSILLSYIYLIAHITLFWLMKFGSKLWNWF